MDGISSQIKNHHFVKELANDQIPIIEKQYREIKDSGQSMFQLQNPDVLSTPSEFEEYLISVFLWSMRIVDCFKMLEDARVYLSHFRSTKWCLEAGIGRIDHMNYHYFNYAITIVRIMDVALILTNNTFRLGNPTKLCRLENIIKNSWVRSEGVDILLRRLNSVVEPWREPRNLFVHRGKTLDRRSMHILETLEFLSRENLLTNISSSDTKPLYKPEISRIFTEFAQTKAPLFNATSNLLSGLLPIYRFWRKILQQTSSA